KTDLKGITLFVISLALITLTALSKRFAEYSVPVTLWICAHFFTAYFQNFGNLQLAKRYKTITVVAFIIYGILFFRSYKDVQPQFKTQLHRLVAAGDWLKKNVPPGERIFTCDWDDAPALFYANHTHRYLVFLDPNFMYF